jgi:hypothetical protein
MPEEPETKSEPKDTLAKPNLNPDGGKDGKPENNKDIGRVMMFFYWAISIALALTGFGAAKGGYAGGITAVLWATGGLAVGTFAGFLFGIPKILQRGQTPGEAVGNRPASGGTAEQSYRQQVNTNLTEISDWLTKIIVGLGLIHLKQAPAFIQGKATVLASSLKALDQTGDYHAFAVAVIVTFPAFGFLFGYLSTRLYLASAFARADLAAMNSAQTAADATSGAVESLSESVKVLTAKVNQMGTPPTPVPPVAPPLPGKLPPETPPTPMTPSVPPSVPVTPVVLETEKATDPDAELKRQIIALASEYGAFSSRNKFERISERNRLSDQLAVLINRVRPIRDWVTETALLNRSEGLIAGLATAINAEPEPDDLDRLLQIAQVARYKHSKYRVATALGRLFDSGLATSADADAALAVMAKYSAGDVDDSLTRRIRQTIAQIRYGTGMTSSNLPPESNA